MAERQRQSIAVVLTLAGVQDTAAAVHQPLTANAAISVRVGSSLLYLHDPATVAKFANAWVDMSEDARSLVREIGPAVVAVMPGMREPGVVVHATGSPPCAGITVRDRDRYPYLRLQIGRVLFNVRDLGAYASTAGAFRQAVDFIPTAFGPHAEAGVRRKALEDAARAFHTPQARRRITNHPRSAARPAPALPAPDPGATR